MFNVHKKLQYYILLLLYIIIIEIKSEIDGKISPYSFYIDGSFKKLATIDDEELSDLLKKLI